MKLTPEDLQRLETKQVANIIRKISAGKTPTARESEILARSGADKDAKPDITGFVQNLDDLADAIGIDRRTITNARTKFSKEFKARKKELVRADGRYHVATWKQFIADCGIVGRGGDHLDDERQIRVEHARLRLERDRFEFEQERDRMLPSAEFEATLQHFGASLLNSLNAFTGRVNPLLEGLDFHDRAAVIESEVEIIRNAIFRGDHLPKADAE